MKDFLSYCKPKKMSVEDLAELIYEYQQDIIKGYIKKAHDIQFTKTTLNELFNRMANPKFAKAINFLLKKKNKDVYNVDCGLSVVIGAFIERKHNNEEVTEELIETYLDIINKLLKPRVKEVEKKCPLNKTIITDLLVVAPSREYISNEKFVGVYSQKMLKKLYALSKEADLGLTAKDVSKMFKAILGKDLLDVIAVNVLLEKKDFIKGLNEQQQAVWNIMTDFALSVIEKEDKKHVVELLEYYVERRINDSKRNKDAQRRIQIASVVEEDYPKITKAVKKLSKDTKMSQYL